MADKTVWIDLDEVEAAAKKILGLLDELNGPANQLAAKVKQVKETVYGTDLVGKAIQGGSSSVGGIAEHQEQVLEGIRVLIQNATAVGENLQSMVARHRANDDQQAAALGGVMGTGTMPAGPGLASAEGYVSAGTPTLTPQHVMAPLAEHRTAPTVGHLPFVAEGQPLQPAQAHLPLAPRGRLLESEEGELPRLPLAPMESAPREHTEQLHGRPVDAPPPPPPIEGLGDIDPGDGYHSAEVPDLDYNTPPPPPYMGPGMWTPTGHGI
ncbi:hypothetical protein [Kitasatospora phosalacinea]|uniref:Uncharacterized protein n=1 Tax=Kitasatospora phosalacinea TaxID=2065 RepID=A0A9W6UME4_9ACTN|nr:hypothetical protein [Kitasatospora phosalacinea]GLW53609.1 hypothetical protein Kpho01_16200 [Kitasatospora phosalacinea]